MKYRIHGTAKDGTEDSIILEADTIPELRKQAKQECDKRGWDDCWSEEVE